MLVGTKSDSTQEAFLYRISTDTKGTVWNFGTTAYDNFKVTPNNNVVAVWGSGVCTGTAGGPFKIGTELFDSNMNWLRCLSGAGHNDVGRDVDGSEVLVRSTWGDDGLPCLGVEKVKLADASKTCIFNASGTNLAITYTWVGFHNFTSPHSPWVIFTVGDGLNPGTASYPLSSTWQTDWWFMDNELVAVKIDGTAAYRLNHHRSRLAGDYWKQPHATPSWDGKYIIYGSDFGVGRP